MGIWCRNFSLGVFRVVLSACIPLAIGSSYKLLHQQNLHMYFSVKKKEKKKKKRIANVVSFDEDGSEELKPHRLGSTNSAGSNSTTGEDWNHESFHHHRNISVSHRGSRSSSLDDPVFLTNEAFKDSSTSNSETTGEDMLDGKHPPFQNQLSLGTTSITTSNMGDNLSKTSTGSVSSSDFENG